MEAMITHLALLATKVNVTDIPKAIGLTAADLIAILAIIVTVFGLLLTAIGTLILRQFNSLDARITEVKGDLKADISAMQAQVTSIQTVVGSTRPPTHD